MQKSKMAVWGGLTNSCENEVLRSIANYAAARQRERWGHAGNVVSCKAVFIQEEILLHNLV